MKIILLLNLLCCSLLLTAAPKEGTLGEGMLNPGYHTKPNWFKNSFLDIREDISEAATHNKRIMLYFYQDGCPYCQKLLESNFGQHNINQYAQKHFDVIAINIWGDRDVTDLTGNDITEKVFAKQLRVQFTPTLVLLNEKGQVVLRINGYYPPHKFLSAMQYVAGKHEMQTKFAQYYHQQRPKPAASKLHYAASYLKPPYHLHQRTSKKPLLVLFAQSHCQACDELQLDIFRRPATKKLLSKFDILLLDRWGKTPLTLPNTKTSNARTWANQLQINYTPSMVFFTPNGQEIFRTEAYLKAFHIQSILDYVASGAYLKQPNFQRYISTRADRLEAQGITINLME